MTWIVTVCALGLALDTPKPHGNSPGLGAAGRRNQSMEDLLFMIPDDVLDRWGKMYPKQVLPEPVPSSVCGADCDTSRPWGPAATGGARSAYIQGGLLAPNPRRPAAGYELFFQSTASSVAELLGARSDAAAAAGSTVAVPVPGEPKGIFFSTTTDFVHFTPPARVATLNSWDNATQRQFPKAKGCIPKSMARSDDGDAYAILTICNDAGFRPITGASPWLPGGFGSASIAPAFWDHDDSNLVWANPGFVDYQVGAARDTPRSWSCRRYPRVSSLARCTCVTLGPLRTAAVLLTHPAWRASLVDHVPKSKSHPRLQRDRPQVLRQRWARPMPAGVQARGHNAAVHRRWEELGQRRRVPQ